MNYHKIVAIASAISISFASFVPCNVKADCYEDENIEVEVTHDETVQANSSEISGGNGAESDADTEDYSPETTDQDGESQNTDGVDSTESDENAISDDSSDSDLPVDENLAVDDTDEDEITLDDKAFKGISLNQPNQESVDVSSAEDLELAINSNISNINIINDFEIDRTYYVLGTTNIYSSEVHVLTRASSFAGDIFVVGENAEGEASYTNGESATLTLGNPEVDSTELLVIDGNSSNMQADVTGSVLFICYGAEANVNKNCSFVNHHKTGNERSLNEKYHLPYPERIGGSVAIVANGVLNIKGGRFSNNSVNQEGSEEGADRTSSMGAVIFNYSNLNIYDGEFSQNNSGRGGVIYNYRMLHVYGGHFDSNYASKYGGVVYQAETQFGELLIGEKEGYTALFENNSAQNSGGVIYSQTKNAVILYGNAEFKKNKALAFNGGAINITGTLTVKDVIFFEENSANSKGGAIYIVNDDPKLTTRIVSINKAVFKKNIANRGGAVGIMASEEGQKEGGIANFVDCTFEENEAAKLSDDTTDMNGGAIYINRKSTVTLSGSSFIRNKSQDEGGAIYCSGESTLTIENSTFTDNGAVLEDSGNGGAVAVHSGKVKIAGTDLRNNSAGKNGGALYISYVSDSTLDSDVILSNSKLENNSADHGGAVYLTSHVESGENALSVDDTDFVENHALYNGGALYSTSSKSYLTKVNFKDNFADATENESGNRYGGGAVYLTKSTMEINSADFINNTSEYNAGAIAVYSNSNFIGNMVTAEGNLAEYNGGAIYTNKSSINLYHSKMKRNNAKKNGGGIAFYTEAVSNIYTTEFTGNSANNGGGIYVYTGDAMTMIRDCEFTSNLAVALGGASYASNASKLTLFNNKVIKNKADNGGAVYITTTGTIVNVAAFTVSGNEATSGGPIIYGNTKKAILNIDKDQYADLETEILDDAYWATAIANKLTVNFVSLEIPEYEDYSHEIIPGVNPEEKDSEGVEEIFALENSTEDEFISDLYENLPAIDNKSNFFSRGTTIFENINGKTVTVDSLVNHGGEKAYNPNVAEGVLIFEAMKYKKKYPEKDVYVGISSFHFSVEAAVCINRNSRYWGYMRQLPGKNYDKNGFVRIAYLLISAAKMGIHVNVMGQIEAAQRTSGEPGFAEYFESFYYDKCDIDYVPGGVVKDYLLFNKVKWTSYGDEAATDMMHTKICTVSNYIDKNGVEHSGSLWLSCINLDGIYDSGENGNNNIQTGCVVSDHDRLYQVAYNYLKLMSRYCGQEDIYEFRNIVWEKMTKQIDLINEGKEEDIPSYDRLVYLGSTEDDVFELYFSPFGGNSASWDEKYNPFCRYLGLMNKSDDYIWLIWNNPKYNTNFVLGNSFENIIVRAFHKNKNAKNKLFICLSGFDASRMDDLVVGTDIGYKSIGNYPKGWPHSKDLQISYSQNGERKYVSLLNSMNIHQGSMSYQSNHLLVIKEDNGSEGSVFYTIADQTSAGVVEREDNQNSENGDGGNSGDNDNNNDGNSGDNGNNNDTCNGADGSNNSNDNVASVEINGSSSDGSNVGGYAVGDEVKTLDSNAICRITSVNEQGIPIEGSYIHASKSKKKTITIPKKVTLENGCEVKITGIGDRAFKGNKKIRKVVIGKNIKKIGKKAFYNCSNLRVIKIKCTGLKLKSVGKKAFEGIEDKSTVYIPAKCKNKYPKLLEKRGLPKTSSIFYPKWVVRK